MDTLIFFLAGMCLIDTTDGALMMTLYTSTSLARDMVGTSGGIRMCLTDMEIGRCSLLLNCPHWCNCHSCHLHRYNSTAQYVVS